jgi:hypothetical protein
LPVFAQSLGDTIFYVTTEAQRLASLALEALSDVPTRSWLIIGLVAVLTQRLWSRRPGR